MSKNYIKILRRTKDKDLYPMATGYMEAHHSFQGNANSTFASSLYVCMVGVTVYIRILWTGKPLLCFQFDS